MAELIRNIRILQLDYSSAVVHSHFLVLRSRLGSYDPQSLEDIWSPYEAVQERELHATSLVHRDHAAALAALFASRRHALRYSHRRNLGPEPAGLLDEIHGVAIDTGRPICAADLDLSRLNSGPRSSWWRRSTARVALDALAYQGRLLVHSRRRGVPHYVAVPEETAPHAPSDKDMADCLEWVVLQAIAHQGAANVPQIADYYRIPVSDARAAVLRLMDQGRVILVQTDFSRSPWYMRPEDLDQVEEREPAEVDTLLSPFDNLIWHRARTREIFSFKFRNTMYLPKADREATGVGYFVMPFLHRGDLVARVDLRIDRANGVLRVLQHSIEDGCGGQRRSIARALDAAVADLAAFADAQDIEWH